MSVIPDSKAQILPRVDGLRTLLDGVAGEFGQNEWVRLDYTVPLAIHVQTVTLRWLGAQMGDYGFLNVMHPAGTTHPAEAMAIDDNTLVIAEPYVPVYAASMAVEFWNAADTILEERRRIDYITGNTVVLTDGVSKTHGTDCVIRAVLGSYSPCTGEDNCNSGMRLIGDSWGEIRSENEYTEKLGPGLILGCRFKGADVAGDRKIVVNYRFRMCDGSCEQV